MLSLSPDATGRAAAIMVVLSSTCTYLPCTRTELQHHIFSRFLMVVNTTPNSIHLNSSTHVSFHFRVHPACYGWLSERARRLNFGARVLFFVRLFVRGELELEDGHRLRLSGAAMQGSSNDTPVSFRIRERASHRRTCTRTGREHTHCMVPTSAELVLALALTLALFRTTTWLPRANGAARGFCLFSA